jgi:zinc transport system permease protein
VWDAVWLFRESIAGSLLIAIGCSVLGVYVVLRRVVFVGAALAQLASAGTALALFMASAGLTLGLLTNQVVLTAGATLAGVVFFGLRRQRRAVPSDALLGAIFAAAGAASVLLVAGTAAADIQELFFGGDVLFVTAGELTWIALVVVWATATHVLFLHPFVFVSFDSEMAASLGYRTRLWNLLLFLTFGAVIAVSMDVVGVLLTFAYLVLPGITGLLLGTRMVTMFVASAAMGVTGTLAGFLVSIQVDLPTGSTIIAALTVLTFAAWAWNRVVR